LYIDYVKVYDANGRDLIDLRLADQSIMNYVNQVWTKTVNVEGDTVIYRWYMRDQPPSVDCFAPYAYIDNLLDSISTERVGMQAYCGYTDDTLTHEYFLRENPKEYHIDPYPTSIPQFGTDSSGATYQQGMDTYISWLKKGKEDALANDKNLWVTCQAFAEGYSDTSECPPHSLVYYQNDSLQHSDWYCFRYWHREPTPNEIRLQSFLALCYGAQNLMCFRYLYTNYYDATKGKWFFGTGLYDQFADSLTAKWRELKDFSAPRMDKLGPITKDLTWLGACSDDSVGSFILQDNPPRQSYIYNIVPQSHFPPHVQVGFFKGSDEWGTFDYFMLVNQRCLALEGDSFRVFINKDAYLHWIQNMYASTNIPQAFQLRAY
jgi:hypothetical protein